MNQTHKDIKLTIKDINEGSSSKPVSNELLNIQLKLKSMISSHTKTPSAGSTQSGIKIDLKVCLFLFIVF